MSTTLTSRKKGNPETVPLTDPEAAEGNESEESANEDINEEKNKPDKMDKTTMFLFILLVVLTVMILASPEHMKKRRAKIINSHIHQAATLIEDQRQSLANKYKQLTSTINEEELLKHKEEIEQLHSHLADKQSSIDKLTKDIESQKKMLDEVQKQMKKMKEDQLQFCSWCTMELGKKKKKSKVKCGERAKFIVEKYGGDEDDVKEALVKEYPSCKKKSN